MTELGAIDEDVAFDFDRASALSTELRSTANVLEWQVGERERIRGNARTVWHGRYGDEFDYRVSLAKSDANRFVISLRAAATGLDELTRLAREEQDRRVAARAWVAANDDEGGPFGFIEKGKDWLLGEDDIPPPPPPVQPPTIPLADPGTVVRNQPPPGTAPTWGSGGVSSAKPHDLDEWVTTASGLDDTVTTRKGALYDRHSEFTSTLGWGKFDASSLISAIGTWLTANGTDRTWVDGIARAFKDAGTGTMPDTAIATFLRDNRINTATRTAVTYDEPSLWGTPGTSGYANDPVNTASGNFVEVEVDLDNHDLSRLLRFARTYNSRSDRIGPFGRGWASWASCRLRVELDGAQWVGPDGQEVLVPGPGGAYERVAGMPGLVVADADSGGLRLEDFDGGCVAFDPAGLPVWAEHGPGTRVAFTHEGERLVAMVHPGGRTTSFDWDGDRIVALRCSDGRAVTYRYDTEGGLVEANGGPAGPRHYVLDDIRRVVAVRDGDGVVEVRNTYDDDGRAVAQRSPHGRRSRFRYEQGRITVVDDDAAGPVNTYRHDDQGRLIGAIDGHGHELTKTYDRWGNPIRVVERDGAITLQEWDERSRLVTRTGPDGRTHSYADDHLDRLVEVRDPSGAETRLRYDGAERHPAEIVGPAGGVTRCEVGGGLLRRVVDSDGVEVRYHYDGNGAVAAVTDGVGHTTVYEHDPAGRLTAVVSPSGRRCELAYDSSGRVVEYRDPGGAVIGLEWSPAGRLHAVTDPLGGRRELRIGDDGEVEQVVDELGQALTRRFDALGNLVGVVCADGAKWELAYDQLCRPTSVSDPAGGTWLRDYDEAGRLVATTDPSGVQRRVRFDRAGRIAGIDDGVTSASFERDEVGRIVLRRRPDGSAQRIAYDPAGRPASITDAEGAVWRFSRTPAGRLAGVTDPTGATTRFEYDGAGRRAATVDPLGHRWSYEHDPDGRLAAVTSPTGETIRYEYDAAGRLAAEISPAGGVTHYEHDAAGRLAAVTDPTGGRRQFGWDPRGQLREVVDPNGGVTRYEHDERGFLRRVTDPLGGRTDHVYDPVGRLVERTDPLGRVTRWSYDGAGRLEELVLADGQRRRWWYDGSGQVSGVGVDADTGPIVEIDRDPLGRPVVVADPLVGFRHELGWDGLSRLVTRRRDGVGMRWGYDAAGRRRALVLPDGTETTFDHDPAGRVVAARHPGLGTVGFEHDATGRLVEQTAGGVTRRWHYESGQLARYEVGERTTVLQRDAAGRVIAAITDGERTTYGYDPAGQLTALTTPTGSWTFAYDAAGRLVAETDPGGTEIGYVYDEAHQLVERHDPAGTTRFDYDPAGRRVSTTFPDGSTRAYEWDWLGRLAAVDDTTLRVDALGDLAQVGQTDLAWDPLAAAAPRLRWAGGTAVVGDDHAWATIAADGGVGWIDHDWLGSVPGSSPDPWGTRDPEPGLAFGFRGELGLAGLVWLHHRPYDPETRAFLAPDLLPGVAGTPFVANPYHYAGNDPVGAVDPRGERPMTEADLAAYSHAAADGGFLADVGGGAMVAVGFLGSLNPLAPLQLVVPEEWRPFVATVGQSMNPLSPVLGLGQMGVALVNGETDLDDLGRHFVNGPSTTVGQGLAIMGNGDVSYNDDHGIWVSENTESWTTGRGGTTYGSIFVTPTNRQAVEAEFGSGQRCGGWDDLLSHEAVHSDQWARYGGGIGFPIDYFREELESGGHENNRFEQEADLENGGYVRPPHC